MKFEQTTVRIINGSQATTEPQHWQMETIGLFSAVAISTLLSLLMLVILIGNSLVIAAIILEPKLKTVSNILVASLAVADLLVAALVMPISLLNTITKHWFMGEIVCKYWTTADILMCTASILHLVAISFDRYWAVTDINYVRSKPTSRVLSMMAASWSVSLIISIAPLLGWKKAEESSEITGECFITHDLSYTVFSTVGAFFLPCIVLMIMYGKIYQFARQRIKKRSKLNTQTTETGFTAQTRNSEIKEIDSSGCTTDEAPGGPGPGLTGSLLSSDEFNKQITPIERDDRSSATLPPNGSCSTSGEAVELVQVHAEQFSAQNDDVQLQLDNCTAAGQNNESVEQANIEREFQIRTKIASERVSNGVFGNTSPICSGTHIPLLAYRKRLGERLLTPMSPRKRSVVEIEQRDPQFSRLRRKEIEKEHFVRKEQSKRQKVQIRRERKASRTLAIITVSLKNRKYSKSKDISGAFMFCWLPFFTMALLIPFCGSDCRLPAIDVMFAIFTWCGYLNSAINPIIYNIFNPDFKAAFKNIINCYYYDRARRRSGHLQAAARRREAQRRQTARMQHTV